MRSTPKNEWVEPSDFKPVNICTVEISQPLTEIRCLDEETNLAYQSALVLVKLHGYPMGLVKMEFDGKNIFPMQVADHIMSSLGNKINNHLTQDGLPATGSLPVTGLALSKLPRCQETRLAEQSSAPLISVVIATRDRSQSLASTMRSISNLDYPKFEVILVDNAPKTSETYDFFLQNQPTFEQKNISLRYLREDLPGLAVAHNRGLEAVKAELVAFTDDDVVVDRNWLSELWLGFKAAENVGCVTGLVIPLELKTPAQVFFEEFGGFTKGFEQRIYDLKLDPRADPLFPYTAGRFGTGANMAFQTDFLRESGGFNPAFGIGTPTLGGDDMNAFFKTISGGRKIVYQPSAIVAHQHRRTYKELQRQMYGYGSGLTAFLTNCVLENPGSMLDITKRIPAGVLYAFSPGSPKNQKKMSHYPRDLERIEQKGMLVGPLRLLYSRWQYRNNHPTFNKTEWGNVPQLTEHFLVLR